MGSKSAKWGPYPLADLDRWGPNPLWHRPPGLPKFARVGGPEYVYSIK